MYNIALSAEQIIARQNPGSLTALKMDVKINGIWYGVGDSIISGSVSDSIADNLGFARSNTASLVLDNRNRMFSSKVFQDVLDPIHGKFNGPADENGLGKLIPGLPVRISENVGNTGWVRKFTGYVDDNGFKEAVSKNKDVVTVSFEDEMYKFKRATLKDQTLAIPNFKVSDPLDSSVSLVHVLIKSILPDYDTSLITCEEIPRTIKYLNLTGSLYEILSSLAASVLGIFTITPTGGVYFGSSPFAVIPKSTDSEYRLEGNLKNVTLKAGRNSVKNKITAKIDSTEYKEYQVIWKNDGTVRINPGEIGSPITDPDGEFQCTFGTEAGDKVVYAKNIDDESTFFNKKYLVGNEMKSLNDYGITIERYDVGSKADSVGLRLSNNTEGVIDIPSGFIKIWGEPLCVESQTEINTQDQVSIGLYGTVEQDISSNYITSIDDLKLNAEYILARRKHQKHKLSVKLTHPLTQIVAGSYLDIHEMSVLATIDPLGEFVDKGLNCRVRSAKTTYQKNQAKVSLELDQWDILPNIIFSGVTITKETYVPEGNLALGVTANNTLSVNGVDTGIMRGLDPSDILEGFNYGGGTMNPSMVGVRAVSLYGGTEAEYEVNYGLTNLAHFLVSIKNGENWCIPDNNSIFGIPGKLQVLNGLFIHTGLEKDTLYTYRVQAVTKAGVQSDYLEYSVKASGLAENGIALNSIRANHIKVDAVDINQLTFTGVGGEDYPVTPKEADSILFECTNDLMSTSMDELNSSGIVSVEDGRIIPPKTTRTMISSFDFGIADGQYIDKITIEGRLGADNELTYVGVLDDKPSTNIVGDPYA